MNSKRRRDRNAFLVFLAVVPIALLIALPAATTTGKAYVAAKEHRSRCRPRQAADAIRRRQHCARTGTGTSVLLSLIKTATDEDGDRRLEREAQWLRELAGVDSLEGQVPRLLDEGWRDGRRYLVLSLAQAAMQETRAFTPDHARFLATLGKARFRVSEFEGRARLPVAAARDPGFRE